MRTSGKREIEFGCPLRRVDTYMWIVWVWKMRRASVLHETYIKFCRTICITLLSNILVNLGCRYLHFCLFKDEFNLGIFSNLLCSSTGYWYLILFQCSSCPIIRQKVIFFSCNLWFGFELYRVWVTWLERTPHFLCYEMLA